MLVLPLAPSQSVLSDSPGPANDEVKGTLVELLGNEFDLWSFDPGESRVLPRDYII